MEDEMMGNESKDHRRYANMYSIERRAGDEAGGCSGLERRRSHNAKGSIVSKNDLAFLISGCYEKIENGDEYWDIEKSERPGVAPITGMKTFVLMIRVPHHQILRVPSLNHIVAPSLTIL
jgi:hypothetical protein